MASSRPYTIRNLSFTVTSPVCHNASAYLIASAKKGAVIRDVHNTIQLIRKTVDGQSLNEAEKEALSSQLKSLTQELSTLEKEIAGKDPTKLRVRIVLALKSAETERALQRLEGHKTTLLLHLQALDL